MKNNVSIIIDEEPISRIQVLVLILISAAVIVDGFDIQMIAFVAPVLIDEWGISRSDLSPAVSAALLGMALGAPIGGWIGDRVGRRRAIIFSTFFFGITTFPVALSENIMQLSVLRFITGLGFGSLLPNATSMIAEWMPRKIRNYAVSMMIIGVPVGGVIGAAASSWLLSNFGWQSCFIAGGAMALILSMLLYLMLPESPKYLTLSSEDGRAVAVLLNRAFGDGRFSENEHYISDEEKKGSWRDIFSPIYRRITIAITIAFFSGLLVFYGFANWIPAILTSIGMPISAALKGAMLFNLFGLVGTVVVTVLISKLGSRVGLLLALIGGILGVCAFIFFLETEVGESLYFFAVLSVIGAMVAGLQVGLYSLAVASYPTSCRSTAVGFFAGFGRLGAIFSAFVGGLLLDLQNGSMIFCAVIIVALLSALLSMFLMSNDSYVCEKEKYSGDKANFA